MAIRISEKSQILCVDSGTTNFMPLIHDIVKSIEKDSGDFPQKIQAFSARIQEARNIVHKLPGIDNNEADQLKQLEVLRKQFENKSELLRKYKNTCDFAKPNEQLATAVEQFKAENND